MTLPYKILAAAILLAAILAAGWAYIASERREAFTAGKAECMAFHQRMQTLADADARKRQSDADEIARTTAEQARAATPEIQRETAAAKERVRIVTRTVEAACDHPTPVEVLDEFVKAVERANG